MTLLRSRFLGATLVAMAAALTACGNDDNNGGTGPSEPLAYVRYVHAIPDLGYAIDVHPVDRVENFPGGIALPYRGVTAYMGVAAGARHFRAFRNTTRIDSTSIVLLDTTFTFTAGTYYTILHTGYLNTSATQPKHQWVVLTDNPATPSKAQIAVRAVNAVAGQGAFDLYFAADTNALPAAPAIANVAYGTPSAYAARDTGALVLRATPRGATTPAGITTMQAGEVGTTQLDPVAGSRIGGSAFTAFIFPGASATARPVTTYGIDRRPPR